MDVFRQAPHESNEEQGNPAVAAGTANIAAKISDPATAAEPRRSALIAPGSCSSAGSAGSSERPVRRWKRKGEWERHTGLCDLLSKPSFYQVPEV